MLTIGPKATIANAENFLSLLSRASPNDAEILNIPHHPSHFQCGGLAATIQAIITWSRTRSELDRKVTFNFREFAPERVDAAVEELPGLVGVLMSTDLLNTRGVSLRHEGLWAAGRRIDRMTRLHENKYGPSMSLLCADRTTKRALPAFYHPRANGGGVLKDETEFIALARTLLDLVVQNIRRPDIAGFERPLGVLLRELFDNTHRHARTDTNERQYGQSVRGVYVAHHGSLPVAMDRAAEGYPPLQGYLGQLEKIGRAGAQRQFLELSVFDSGPGLAARIRGAPIPSETSAETEFSLVIDCFRKNVSTVNRPGGGAGLSRVLLRLKEGGGFLRLRTGRMSLHRDFSANYGQRTDLHDEDLRLEDASGGAPSLQPWVAGTAMTLLLPLRLGR